MKKSFIIIAFILLIGVVLRSLLGLSNYHIGIDDTNIYFVYVKNLDEGHGFVYNPGGERVEGVTSLLWTILLSLIYKLKFLPFETSLLVFSFFITAATLFIYYRYVKNTYSAFSAWILLLYILLTPGFIDWNVFTLLDTCLWIFGSSLATFLLLSGKNERLFLVVCILLPLIRPEGIALSIILFLLKLLKDYASLESWGKSWRKNMRLFLWICLVIFLLTLFRLLYFGYPFPNTFYAKVSMSIKNNMKEALFYSYNALRHTSCMPFILFLVCIFNLVRNNFLSKWKANINAILLVIIIFFFILNIFLTGGDFFPYSRFFQPVFPLIGLLFVTLFHDKIKWNRPVIIASVCVVLLMVNLNSKDDTSFRKNWGGAVNSYFRKISVDFLGTSQLQNDFNIAVNGRRIADHMNKILAGCDSMPSYGIVAAGGIGYKYKGKKIDLMGLNNPEMAHAIKIKKHDKNHGSFSKRIFYQQNVDIFLTWPDPVSGEMLQKDEDAFLFLRTLNDSSYFINRVCDHIFNDPEFNRIYSFCKISNNKEHFYGFIKPEFFKQKYPEVNIKKL